MPTFTTTVRLDALKAQRVAAGLSQEKLARLLEPPCSTSTITLAERGARVSEQMAVRIAAALGVSIADLETEA